MRLHRNSRSIHNLQNKNVSGNDIIINAFLKFFFRNLILLLTNIINDCLKIYYFSTVWKKEIIISISKPSKDKTLPKNYRPIALLSFLSKIYEHIILTYLQKDLNTKIRPLQFAFRPEHSKTLLLIKLTH